MGVFILKDMVCPDYVFVYSAPFLVYVDYVYVTHLCIYLFMCNQPIQI